LDDLPPLPKPCQKGWIFDSSQMRAYALEAIDAWSHCALQSASKPAVQMGLQSGWQTGTPPTKKGEYDEYIVAVKRKHDTRKVFVFSAYYANEHGKEELHDQDGNQFICNGWFNMGHDMSDEFDALWVPMLGDGDEVLGWQELPKWYAAPAQSGEPVYQIQVKTGSTSSLWFDVNKEEWERKDPNDFDRRIVYAAPQPFPTVAVLDEEPGAPIASTGSLDEVKPMVDSWIRQRGTSMDGESYVAALQLAAFIKAGGE